MIRVEFRRHSHKERSGPGDVSLSDAGVRFAEQVGTTQLRGHRFTHLFWSTRRRTQETLTAFIRGAGDFPAMEPQLFAPHVALYENPGMHLWKGVCRDAEQRGEDMLIAALRDERAATTDFSRQIAASFRKWLTTLPDGANALVVDHSPEIELLVLGLTEKQLTQLQPCDGCVLTMQPSGEVTVVRVAAQ